MDIVAIGYCVRCNLTVFNSTMMLGWHILRSPSGVTYVCPSCVSAMGLPLPKLAGQKERMEEHEDAGRVNHQHGSLDTEVARATTTPGGQVAKGHDSALSECDARID